MSAKRKLLSLFSGCGGMDLGFTGSFFCNEKSVNKTLHPDLESIVDLVKKARNGDFSFPKNIDVVTGGVPFQDFSVAGKRLGFNSQKSHLGTVLATDEPSVESRGQLYIWMRDVITLTEPKIFIAENVKGLTNLADAKAVIEHDFSTARNGGRYFDF